MTYNAESGLIGETGYPYHIHVGLFDLEKIIKK